MTHYSITDGQKIVILSKVTTLTGAVAQYVASILRDEYNYSKNEENKYCTKENLQAAYDEWVEMSLENMQNDGYESGKYIVCLEEMTDNWSNREWICTKNPGDKEWTSINNSEQYKLINDYVASKGVIEREIEIL